MRKLLKKIAKRKDKDNLQQVLEKFAAYEKVAASFVENLLQVLWNIAAKYGKKIENKENLLILA